MLNDHFVMETFRIVPIIATNNIGIDNPAKVSKFETQTQMKKTFFFQQPFFEEKIFFQ